MAGFSSLPPESLDAILCFFKDAEGRSHPDCESLYNLCLVSQSLRSLAQLHLFQDILIEHSTLAIPRLVQSLKSTPRLASYVGKLRLSGITSLLYTDSTTTVEVPIPDDAKYDHPIAELLQVKVLPNLKTLSLRLGRWGYLSANTKASIKVLCDEQLEALEIYDTDNFPPNLVLSSLTLRHLKLESRVEIFDRDDVEHLQAAVAASRAAIAENDELALVRCPNPVQLRLESFESKALDGSLRNDLINIDPDIFSQLKSFRGTATRVDMVPHRVLFEACSGTLETLDLVLETTDSLPDLRGFTSLQTLRFHTSHVCHTPYTRLPKGFKTFHPTQCLQVITDVLATVKRPSPLVSLDLHVTSELLVVDRSNWAKAPFVHPSEDYREAWRMMDTLLKDEARFPALNAVNMDLEMRFPYSDDPRDQVLRLRPPEALEFIRSAEELLPLTYKRQVRIDQRLSMLKPCRRR